MTNKELLELLRYEIGRLEDKLNEVTKEVARLEHLRELLKEERELGRRQGYAIGELREAKRVQGDVITRVVQALKQNDIDVPIINIQNNSGASTGVQGKGNQIKE